MQPDLGLAAWASMDRTDPDTLGWHVTHNVMKRFNSIQRAALEKRFPGGPIACFGDVELELFIGRNWISWIIQAEKGE